MSHILLNLRGNSFSGLTAPEGKHLKTYPLRSLIFFLTFLLPTLNQAQTAEGKIVEHVSEAGYSYILHQPAENTKPKPLILFLHGSGEKGNNPELLKVHGPLKYLESNQLDAWILVPQCPLDEYWDTEKLMALLQHVISENKIDQNGIHLTGLSMGAWGAWNFAVTHPEILASLVPIAGFVDRIPLLEACDLKDIPTRIYHGLLDDVVNVFYSIEMFKRMRTCSDKVELMLFEDASHDSWSRVYDKTEIYEWILQQKK